MSGFRLAGLLRLRAVREERAKSELAEANTAVRQATDELGRRRHALRSRGNPQDGPAVVWLSQVAARSALAADVAAAAQFCEVADSGAAHSAERWARARGDNRALERLAERHEEQQRYELERRAQTEADDRSATAAFTRSRRAPEPHHPEVSR